MILVMPWVVLTISISFPLVLSKFIKNRAKLNLIVDLIMIGLGLFLFTTSIFKWMLIPSNPVFLLGLTHGAWSQMHNLSGMILSGLVTAHIILHWKWIVTLTKKTFTKKSVKK